MTDRGLVGHSYDFTNEEPEIFGSDCRRACRQGYRMFSGQLVSMIFNKKDALSMTCRANADINIDHCPGFLAATIVGDVCEAPAADMFPSRTMTCVYQTRP